MAARLSAPTTHTFSWAMSKIYNDSNVFCTNNDKHNGISDISFNSIYPLADLYFCPSCQIHKSPLNCFYNIESKFCSNCLSDYSKHSNDTTYCVKNCFECPQCTSLLTITVADHTVNKTQGKSFKFKCVYCQYSYQTSVITSPKPLHVIVRSESEIGPDDLYKHVATTLSEGYKDRFKWKRPDVDDVTMKNLSLSNMSLSPKFSNQIDDETSIVQARQKKRTFTGSKPKPKYPQPKKLSVKKSLRCLSCNSYLYLPHTEPDQVPTVNKFVVKFNAADYLPSIKLSLPIPRSMLSNPAPSPPKVFKIGNQYNFLINVMSPLNQDLKIQISALPTIPQYFISPQGTPLGTPTLDTDKFNISLTLAVSQFTIKSNPLHAKNLIKSIPTSFLTSNTTISRSELVLRLGNTLLKNNDTTIDYNNIENLESLVDSGNNWYQIPINLLVEETSQFARDGKYNVSIPLYITVNSELPESIKKLNLSKKSLSFGYWNIVNLGEYQFVSNAHK